MKRAPFKMLASRSAVYRRDGRFVVSGRASYVWEQLVKARAAGVPGMYEIKRGERGAPWHLVMLSVEEAEALLGEGVFGRASVARSRRVRESRRTRGLPVA